MFRISDRTNVLGAGRVSYRYSPDGRLRLTCNFRYYKEIEKNVRSADMPVVRGKSDNSGVPTCQSGKTSTEGFRRGFGRLGRKKAMSREQARNVRERVAAIDRRYCRRNTRFLTVTLPSIDPRAFRALARYCSYVVNRLNVWLNRLVGDHARVSVWEYQDRGALHLHAIVGGNQVCKVTTEALRSQWVSILRDIGKLTGANMFLSSTGLSWLDSPDSIRVESAIPEKCLSAYLSKYLSKGNHRKGADLGAFSQDLHFPVASWAQWNRPATALHRKYTETGTLGYVQGDAEWQALKARFTSQVSDALVPETSVLDSDNPYNHSIYCIPDRERLSVIAEALADAGDGLLRSGYVGLSRLSDYEDADAVSIRFFERLRRNTEASRVHDEALRIASMQWGEVIASMHKLIASMQSVVQIQYPECEQLEVAIC